MAAARDAAEGHEALLVSHQLPIGPYDAVEAAGSGTTRAGASEPSEQDPFTYEGTKVVSVGYSEPAADLLPVNRRVRAGA